MEMFYEYKINNLRAMREIEKEQPENGKYGAHLQHWAKGSSKPINLDEQALTALIEHYEERAFGLKIASAYPLTRTAATIKARTHQLRLMHEMMKTANDEDLYARWIAVGVPDEPDRMDMYEIAQDDEEYAEVFALYNKLVQSRGMLYGKTPHNAPEKFTVELPKITQQGMKAFTERLMDYFKETAYEDKSVGICGMSEGEGKLANTLLLSLEKTIKQLGRYEETQKQIAEKSNEPPRDKRQDEPER